MRSGTPERLRQLAHICAHVPCALDFLLLPPPLKSLLTAGAQICNFLFFFKESSPLVEPRAALEMWWMLFPRWIWFLLCASVWMEHQVGVLPQVTYSHAGICPNDMNPNLWVDAMSTCTRECVSDQVMS